MEFLNERAARRAVRREMRTSERAELAVAFWGEGAAEKLGIEDREPGRVRIICNLTMGGTNPSEIEKLIELGHDVVRCDQLHAKCYIFDEAVLVGSSNASSNGLAFQDNETLPWFEANILSRDVALVARVRRWLSRLPTKPITEQDLLKAHEAWKRRRQAIHPVAAATLIEKLRASPTFFDGKQIFLAVVSKDMDAEGELGREEAQEEYGPELDAYQDWPELPETGTLIAFERGPRGGLSFGGFWERRPIPRDRTLRSGSTLQLCWEMNDAAGMTIGDMSAWRDICRRFFDDSESDWDAEGGCGFVDLSDVARKYLD